MAYRLSSSMFITIGKNIKKIRKQQKRDQLAVAVEAGIEPGYYSRIERGSANTSLEKIYAIARALRVKSSDILPF